MTKVVPQDLPDTMGNAACAGHRFDHDMIGSQFEKRFELGLVANHFSIEMTGTEGNRVDRLIIAYRAGEKVPNTRQERRLRSCAGGTGEVNVLADQPAAKSQPHSQAT